MGILTAPLVVIDRAQLRAAHRDDAWPRQAATIREERYRRTV